MTSDQELDGRMRAAPSALDLQQIKEAVNELRASNPESALADLVDERIREIDNGTPASQFDAQLPRARQVLR
jgi:hypothetical protein